METRESTRLLKANDIRGLGSKVAFNFEDIRRRCDEHIEESRRQARELLDTAQAEADALRRTAYAEGFAAGQEAGSREADQEIQKRADRNTDDKIRTTIPALQTAAEVLVRERDCWMAAWESAAVRLSVAIAEKLLRHEIHVRPELSQGMLATALELAAGSPHIRLRLHPDDLERLGEHAQDVVRTLAACGEATLIPDPSIASGGCVVETQHGTIDGRLETQLQRIAEELLQVDS